MEFVIIHNLQTRVVKKQYGVVVIFQFYDDVEAMFNRNSTPVFEF